MIMVLHRYLFVKRDHTLIISMKLFHNIHDKFSREYIGTYGEGVTIVDWYNGQAEQWTNESSNPHPSMFPGILIETSDEFDKLVAAFGTGSQSSWTSSFFVYPENIDTNLNLLK